MTDPDTGHRQELVVGVGVPRRRWHRLSGRGGRGQLRLLGAE